MVSGSVLLLAATLRVFGSGGAESQFVPAQHNVADVSAFGDLSANRWKLHMKLRADASDHGADRLRAGEAYAQWRATEWLDVTAGRVIEKWGTGYAWNPTSFVGPAKDPTDPGDRRSAYRGVDMLRADVFVRHTDVSLYALEDGQYAARVYRLIRGTDVSLVWKSGQVGMSLSRVFGDALELHAEATPHRALAGGQYTFTNDVNVIVEMYYDQKPFAFARVYRPFRSAKLDAELLAIADIHAHSAILRASLTRKLHANIAAYLIETEFVGREKPVARVTTAGIRYYF
jgi:hypothetical protein